MRTFCLKCGCIIERGSHCKAHRPPKSRPGSTRQWRKVRAQVLLRGGHRCWQCGRRATHADHIIPVKHGGTDSPVNLRASCAACNLERGARASA